MFKPASIARISVFVFGLVFSIGLLSGCSLNAKDSSGAYVPATGSASGLVVPNARPAMK